MPELETKFNPKQLKMLALAAVSAASGLIIGGCSVAGKATENCRYAHTADYCDKVQREEDFNSQTYQACKDYYGTLRNCEALPDSQTSKAAQEAASKKKK